MASFKDDPAFLFELVIPGQMIGDANIRIRAFDRVCNWNQSPSHNYFEIEVRQGGKTIFPRGKLWGGIPNGHSTDGKNAREHAISVAATKPGDTDEEYFADYTDDQKDWASSNGEYLSMIAESRYPGCA